MSMNEGDSTQWCEHSFLPVFDIEKTERIRILKSGSTHIHTNSMPELSFCRCIMLPLSGVDPISE